MQAWYKDAKPPSRLDSLTVEMLKLPGKPPKLRSKAGECRYLLPFAAQVASEYNDGTVHRSTVDLLMQNLLEISACISVEPYDHHRASAACDRMCSLYAALETVALAQNDSASWRIKPKLHMIDFVHRPRIRLT